MLPEDLSNGICSLNPHEDRLVMSAIVELDANGEIVASEFARGSNSLGRAHDLHGRQRRLAG